MLDHRRTALSRLAALLLPLTLLAAAPSVADTPKEEGSATVAEPAAGQAEQAGQAAESETAAAPAERPEAAPAAGEASTRLPAIVIRPGAPASGAAAGAIPTRWRTWQDPGAQRWRGAPISLSLRDADLVEVLRSIARLAGINLVIHPGVGGTVTLELTDVPWDQALHVILKTQGLGAELDGNVLAVGH